MPWAREMLRAVWWLASNDTASALRRAVAANCRAAVLNMVGGAGRGGRVRALSISISRHVGESHLGTCATTRCRNPADLRALAALGWRLPSCLVGTYVAVVIVMAFVFDI